MHRLRLSLFQVFVATSVLATLIAANATARQRKSHNAQVLFFGQGIRNMDVVETDYGWPYTFKSNTMMYPAASVFDRRSAAASCDNMDLAPLAIDVGVAVITLMSTHWLAGRWNQRVP